MAATVKVYGEAGKHLAQGNINWVSDTIKLAFTTSAYAVDQGNDEFFSSVTNELTTGGGYTAGGFTLTGKAVSYDATTREYRFDADDINIAALTPSSPFRYGVVYDATPGSAATDILIAYINFGADQSPAGLPFPIQWPGTGVWYTQAS